MNYAGKFKDKLCKPVIRQTHAASVRKVLSERKRRRCGIALVSIRGLDT